MEWIWIIIVGGIAGWISTITMAGRGFGLIGNIITGVVGAIIGKFVFDALGSSFIFFLEAVSGATILLFLAGFFKRSNANS